MARQKIHENAAERVRAWRAAKGVVAVTFDMPADLLERFNEFLKFKDVKKSAVLCRLIETQLLRKR